jgi:hypothetical protein
MVDYIQVVHFVNGTCWLSKWADYGEKILQIRFDFY